MGITKRGGRFRAEVFRRSPQYESATFGTKREAELWIAQKKADASSMRLGFGSDRPFSDALTRYRDTVSPGKRGHQWESVRINLFIRDPIASVRLRALASNHVAEWRDRRLCQVSPESVRREWNLLSAVCTICVKEWKWLKENPFSQVRRPPAGKARERLVQDWEVEALRIASGYPAHTVAARTFATFLFALETGMRASEICCLSAVSGAVALLPITKNGSSRQVPLSPKALEIWAQYPNGFGLTPTQLDANFRRLKRLAGIEGLHFHDSRANAITRMAKILDPLTLARVVGHKNIKELMTYYREPMEDIAARLAEKPKTD